MFYGTNTGTSEGLSGRVATDLAAHGTLSTHLVPNTSDSNRFTHRHVSTGFKASLQQTDIANAHLHLRRTRRHLHSVVQRRAHRQRRAVCRVGLKHLCPDTHQHREETHWYGDPAVKSTENTIDLFHRLPVLNVQRSSYRKAWRTGRTII